MANANKGGRPARYEGEVPVRIGGSIRPRYKEMLDSITRHRDSSMNETIEFIIGAIARNYFIEEKSVHEWVLPAEQTCKLIYDLYKSSQKIDISDDLVQLNENSFQTLFLNVNKPKSFLSNIDKYILKILDESCFLYKFMDDFDSAVDDLNIEYISKLFNFNLFIRTMEELWRSGEREEVVTDVISILGTLKHAKFDWDGVVSQIEDEGLNIYDYYDITFNEFTNVSVIELDELSEVTYCHSVNFLKGCLLVLSTFRDENPFRGLYGD